MELRLKARDLDYRIHICFSIDRSQLELKPGMVVKTTGLALGRLRCGVRDGYDFQASWATLPR